MLAPKITLRQLLLFMVVVAVFLAIVSLAYRGDVVAFGLSISIATLILVFLVYTVSFWILYGLAMLFDRKQTVTAVVVESPEQKSQELSN